MYEEIIRKYKDLYEMSGFMIEAVSGGEEQGFVTAPCR